MNKHINKNKNLILLFIFFLSSIFLIQNILAIANPSAVFCEESGNKYTILIQQDGAETGYCNVNGELIEGWRYYKENRKIQTNNKRMINQDSFKKINLPLRLSNLNKKNSLLELTKSSTILKKTDLPTSLDWRNYNNTSWITSIKDQRLCNSCWAFSSVSIFESKVNINSNNPNLDVNLSEQDVITNNPFSNRSNCSGGYEQDALNFMKNTGIVNESCMSYVANNTGGEKCVDGIKSKISNYGQVMITNETDIKQALNDYGPITVYMYVDDVFQEYSGGILTHPSFEGFGSYHSISLVGYNDTGNYWICKNSWGTGWGEDGFFRIAYSENVLNYSAWRLNESDARTFFLDESYYITSTDLDSDGILDGIDNCISLPNTNQSDGDGDGIGDVCDDVCTINLVNTSKSEWENITSCRLDNTLLYNRSWIQYDAGNCGTENITFFELNETNCDFCLPNWTKIQEQDKIWFNDTNNCYNQTSLSSDLEDRPLNITLNVSSTNLTQFFDNESNNSKLLEINFNFTEYLTNFSEFKLLKNDITSNISWVIISGMNLSINSSFEKIIYLNKSLNSGLFCVKEGEISNISNISTYCNSSFETLFTSCPSTINNSIGNYTCEIENNQYKIKGLRSSGVKEQQTFCGDSICNSSNETCSSCAVDCGACPVVEEQASSGGGGGGGSSGSDGWSYSFYVNKEKLDLGYNKELTNNQRIKFIFNSQSHSVGIRKINTDYLVLEIASTPKNYTLSINESLKVDLDEDDYLDLNISFELISKTKVNLTIQTINEPIIKMNNNQTNLLENKSSQQNPSPINVNPNKSNFNLVNIISVIIIFFIFISPLLLLRFLFKLIKKIIIKNKTQKQDEMKIKKQYPRNLKNRQLKLEKRSRKKRKISDKLKRKFSNKKS